MLLGSSDEGHLALGTLFGSKYGMVWYGLVHVVVDLSDIIVGMVVCAYLLRIIVGVSNRYTVFDVSKRREFGDKVVETLFPRF